MDTYIEAWGTLVTIGLALLMCMLRLESERFGTAEYYEATRDGERPKIRRRLGWYGLGAGLALGILYIHPDPQTHLFLGSGDRLGAVLGGLIYGIGGIAFAVAFATVRYHRIRFPETWSYPGALLNSVATALIDEVAFRGAIFGLLLSTGMDPTLANVIQAILYTLTTRLGATGRDKYLFFMTLGIGPGRRLADRRDRRHRRGVPGPCHHALRGLPVHRPRRPDQAARARGRGDRQATPDPGGLAGHRGPGGDEGRMRAVPGGPPVALYVHVPFCLSVCPYCDFVVYAGSVARGPRSRVEAFTDALEVELELRADALDASLRAEPPTAREPVSRRRDAVPARRRRGRSDRRARARAVRARRGRRGHPRGQSRTR